MSNELIAMPTGAHGYVKLNHALTIFLYQKKSIEGLRGHKIAMAMIISLIVIALLASCLTTVYFLVSRRRRIPRVTIEADWDITRALLQISGLTGGLVHYGNDATIIQDGYLLTAIMQEIEGAKDTIHLETYLWQSGKTEDELVTLLGRKARQGVVVRLLLDAVGAYKARDSRIAQLKESGVSVAYYHPLNRANIRRFNNRTHRKLLIVDGEIGFTFGHGVKDTWRGRTEDKSRWRDTGLRLQGPVVHSMQMIFSQDWIEAGETMPLGDSCFKRCKPQGLIAAHIVTSSGLGGYSSVALLFMLAIESARKEVLIQNPYFVPNKILRELLVKKVKEGVKVGLMLPGRHTDSPLVTRAGQHLYAYLLKAGISLYLYEKTFLHQKVVIIDGIWSHIGSTNFDARALELNSEIGVGMLDEGVSGQLKEAFQNDLKHCRKLTIHQWEERQWSQKVLDRLAYLFRGQI